MDKVQILVIDDEETIRLVVERTLRRENVELIFAENGQEGLEKFKKCNPTVIILDLQMPIMDGISFLKEIDLKPDDPYAVLVLTGHGNDDDMQECYDHGVHFFLRKPFGYTEFFCQVQRLIKLKQLEEKFKNEAIGHKESLKKILNNDLKDPLNGIIKSLDQIDGSFLPEEQRIFLDSIRTTTKDVTGMINQILANNKN